MTGLDEPSTSLLDAHADILAGRVAARLAAMDLARREGTRLTSRPAFPGSQVNVPNLPPLDGARAARQVELGARYAVRGYIRQAREDGASWDEIGQALGLSPGADPDQAGTTVAEAAYTYAAGNPDRDVSRRYGREFPWTCGTLQAGRQERGADLGPADDEHGDSESCHRLAETITAWHGQWEAGQ
jgi:hypothetical protein